ncbi:nuclear transport factor 2 family protein [Streptomyces sp. NPDC050263]|uniref:nuclear transport factor 2 family protein n=1 Tax=Streptomyces sp. NPDC050263 TaxID=3155037 RepID=UPI0034137CAF
MAIDPKDVVQAFVDTLNRQDWDRLGELITPDFTYTIQAYDLPGAGAPMNGEALVGVLSQMLALFDATGPQIEITRLVGEGSRVVAEAVGSGFFRDGSRYDNRYANVYEISADRVSAVREYMDTQRTAQSFAAVTSERGG